MRQKFNPIVLSVLLFFCACGQQQVEDMPRSEIVQSREPAETSAGGAQVPVVKTRPDFTAFQRPAAGVPFVVQKNEDITQLIPRPGTFEINASEDELIVGSEGTYIAIPSETLVHSDGSAAEGNVRFELTEYVRPSQFAAGGLLTRTVDGELLETVGMLNMVAIQDGDTLQVRKGGEIEVAFPLKSDDPEMKVWEAETNSSGQTEWRPQQSNSADIQEKINAVPVHMKPLLTDQKNQIVHLQTCSGAGWQTYFNNRFSFEAGKGEELLDQKNFLAYSFRVNKKGRVNDVFVDERYYPQHIVALSRKYESEIESYLKKDYPVLNLCRLDYKKQVFRVIIKPGVTQSDVDLVSLSPQEGGYTPEELAAFYEKTGNEVYLNAYLKKMGSNGGKNIPQTEAKKARKILNAALTVAGETGRVILSVASLGLINGDALFSLSREVKYKAGVALRAVVAGTGPAVYMVFKKVRSFITGSAERGNAFTFGNRIPKDQQVVLVAVSEINGMKMMARMDYSTASEEIRLKPDVPFDLKQFQTWLDEPDAE